MPSAAPPEAAADSYAARARPAGVILIPRQLAAACHGVPERMAWLGQLPKTVEELQDRWGLALGQPFSADASCSWVAPAVSQDGTRVVLKLGMPHMETQHEIEGLRFWDGNPTAWLLEADSDVRVSPTCLASKAEIRGRQPDRGMGGTDFVRFRWLAALEQHALA